MVPSANKFDLFDVSTLAADSDFLIAYSGGSDSTALLHFCAHHPALKQRIRAIHINHQLQAQSDDWQQQCWEQCQRWQVPLVTETLDLENASENTARQGRLSAFKKHLKNNEQLLTAHHQQDQAETILFRLLRGTGLKGMTGMQASIEISNMVINRPLLHTDKTSIQTYLKVHQLNWIDDPSNAKNNYSRNQIRNQLLPILERYSQQSITQISETGINLYNSWKLLNDLIPESNPLNPEKWPVDVTFLHHWLQKKGCAVFSQKQLTTFLNDSKTGKSENQTHLSHQGTQLWFWKNEIHLIQTQVAENLSCHWQKSISLDGAGKLSFSNTLPLNNLSIEFGLSGQKIMLPGRKQHQKIKKLHQQQQTPPWQKPITPFVFHQGELLAVGHWVSQTFNALLQQHNCQYTWHKCQQIL